MNQKRQRGFIGPMKVLEYQHIRTCAGRIRQSLRNALEKIAAFLRRRQFQWLRNIGKGASKAWRDLGKFGRIFSHPSAEIVATRRLRQTAFKDLDEGEKGKWFVSFVAVSDQAFEADARRVFRNLHRQAALAHAGSTTQHDN